MISTRTQERRATTFICSKYSCGCFPGTLKIIQAEALILTKVGPVVKPEVSHPALISHDCAQHTLHSQFPGLRTISGAGGCFRATSPFYVLGTALLMGTCSHLLGFTQECQEVWANLIGENLPMGIKEWQCPTNLEPTGLPDHPRRNHTHQTPV